MSKGRVEWWLPGAGGGGKNEIVRSVQSFRFARGTGLGDLFHNRVNILNTTKAMVEMASFPSRGFTMKKKVS